MKFDSIEYLKTGNSRQRQAYATLSQNQVLLKLQNFDPILVGTIPINIDIENSDLDIICCYTDKEAFLTFITHNFSNERNFRIREKAGGDTFSVVANFVMDNFHVEIFGQNIPTKQQFAYRHLVVEYHLLNKYGEQFRQQIIELKRQGYKTEPAFAFLLGLSGDPYLALLKFETEEKNRPL